MKSNIMFRNLFSLLSVIILITACGSPPSEVRVVETDSKQEVIPDIVRINNCGGTADTEQTVTRSFTTTIEGGITAKVDYKIVEGGVSAKYGESRDITKSIKLVAPPGTNMEYALQWTEQTWIGRVTANGDSGNYTARMPISVEQVSAQNLGCVGYGATSFTLDIRPRCGDTYTIEAGKPFTLRYGTWLANGFETTQNNATHLKVELTIDGQALLGKQQPVQRVNDSFPGARCGAVNFETDYGVFYTTEISALASGNHSLQVKYYFDARVTDGYDNDNDGQIDYYEPGLITTFRLTIIAR